MTKGLETYVRLRADETELYLGYVFTDARRAYDPANPHVELAARHKFAAVALTDFTDHFGGGIEASHTGQQYLSDGTTTPAYPIFAALLRYRTGAYMLVLNAKTCSTTARRAASMWCCPRAAATPAPFSASCGRRSRAAWSTCR